MIPPFDPGYWNAGIDMVVRSYDPTPIGGPSFGMPMPEYISNHIPCGETAFERWQRLDFGYPSNSGREMIDVNALNYPHDRPMDPFRDLTPSIPSIPSIPEIRLPWEPSMPEPVYMPVYEPPRIDISAAIIKEPAYKLPVYEPPKTDISFFLKPEPSLSSLLKPEVSYVPATPAYEPRLDFTSTIHAYEPVKPLSVAPIVRSTGLETVFGGAGHSHFSYVRDQGFHVTTQIPGFGRNEGLSGGLSLHDPVKGMFPLLDKFR